MCLCDSQYCSNEENECQKKQVQAFGSEFMEIWSDILSSDLFC